MRGVIPPLTQYVFMAWCLVKAQGQLYLYHHYETKKTVLLQTHIRVTLEAWDEVLHHRT